MGLKKKQPPLLPTALQILGVLVVAAGFAWFSVGLGIIVGGVGAFGIGTLLELQ